MIDSTAPTTGDSLVQLATGDGLARALLEQSPFSTVLYDAGGRPLYVNPAFERLWGVTLADVPADYTVLADPQLDAQGMLPLVRRAFDGEVVSTPPVRYDFSAYSASGRKTWTQGYFYPLRDGRNAVSAVVLVHVDLTARMEAEDALRVSEERLRVALDAGQMGTWEWILPENRVRWSETLERIHGLEPGSFDGTFEAYQRDIHPEDRATVFAQIERTMAGEDHVLRYRIVRPDGQVRWLSARGKLIRDAHGAPQRLVGICTDITEQQRTDEGMRLLAEASAILVSSLDYDETLGNVARLAVSSLADYCIIDLLEPAAPGGVRRVATAHANPAKEALLAEVRNFPPLLDSDGIVARVLRTGVPELVSPIVDLAHEASAEARPGHQAVLARLKPEAVMCVPLVARGATLGTLTCAFAESGRRYDDAYLALATELATRAALAVDNARLHRGLAESREQLERQVEETQAANRAKSEFLAVMSHELRTPLNAIGGYTQLMEMEIHGPVTPEQREDLARIQRSQLHLLSLINDVLNYAKLEAGKVQYHIAPLRLHDALAGVEALVAPQLASKSLRFTYEPPAPELMVRSDAEKLRQILLNLLSNAVKYTPAGGAVRLYTRVEDGRALVSIQDTGTGIHADKLELIFEPFVQLSREPMGVSEGTGLGLAISRELARAMGGDLTAESVPGQGSTFTVIVPR